MMRKLAARTLQIDSSPIVTRKAIVILLQLTVRVVRPVRFFEGIV
jgi:hypothetical protein